jgi:predicted RNA-binding protein with PUA domain
LNFDWLLTVIISYLAYISGFPIGYEEVRSISNPPADVRLGGGFEIDVSAAVIMKRFEQISDEVLNKK